MELAGHNIEFKTEEEIFSWGTQADIQDEAYEPKEIDGEITIGFKKGMGHYKQVKLRNYLKLIDGKLPTDEEIRKLPSTVVTQLLLEIDKIDKKKVEWEQNQTKQQNAMQGN